MDIFLVVLFVWMSASSSHGHGHRI